jgi:hypothetical protein
MTKRTGIENLAEWLQSMSLLISQSALLVRVMWKMAAWAQDQRATNTNTGMRRARRFRSFVRPMLKHDTLREWTFTGADYPAFERAWCLQERILARRVVHYTKSEIVWDCGTKCPCECGGVAEDERESMETFRKPSDEETRMSLMGAYNRGLGKIEHLQYVLASGDSTPEEIEEATFDLQGEAWDLWANVLENYTTRKLTYQSDLLLALSGLARRLQEAAWELTWPACGG